MRSFAIISAIFAAAAIAAPTANNNVVARTPSISDVSASAKTLIDSKSASGCEVLKCVAALAPASVSCAAALVEDGLNPIADAACFASALNTALNPPASCESCA